MTLDAATLLAGPRGRRVCLEYLLAAARVAGTPAADGAVTAVFWAEYARESGSVSVILSPPEEGASPFVPPVVTVEDAASALGGIAVAPPSPDLLREALAAAVDSARYWQEPDGRDVIAADRALRPALVRVAETIASSPDAAWWASTVDLDDQWAVPWEGDGQAPPESVRVVLANWREAAQNEEARAGRERPVDARANWSGVWWSTPPSALVHSSRRLSDASPAGLWFVEDGMGWESAVATPLDTHPARVIEIDGPEAWIDLCRRHPLVVTASRRHDWFRATGREGGWVQPDWSLVADEADGVHLSVTGYLAAAGRALEVREGWATVIGGWNPDTTYWFAGVAARPRDEQRWQRTDDGWERTAP